MLRTGVLRFLRTVNFPTYRSIPCITYRASSQNVRKPLPNVDDLFARDGQSIKPLVEDPIIAKKFFISEVDKEQMLYPEVISKDELDTIINHNQMVSEYIETSIEYDGNGISRMVHDDFKQMGLYGYNVPKAYGGHG